MAQHDYVIDNQASAPARTDINNALLAIVTQNSGDTAPATTYANMIWYETDTNTLWKRNEANSGWISMGTFDETNSKFEPNQTFSTQAEAETGTNNTRASTPLRVAQAINVRAVGIGQTWQNVAGSRAVSTSYQNTTGRPIIVNMVLNGGSTRRYVQVSSDNATWIDIGSDSGSSTPNSFVVPNNWYYRVNGSTTIDRWAELR